MDLIYISPTSWEQPLGGRSSIVTFNSHTRCRKPCALKHRQRRKIRLFSAGNFDVTDHFFINRAREIYIPKKHQDSIRKARSSRNCSFVVQVLDAETVGTASVPGNEQFESCVRSKLKLTLSELRGRAAKARKFPKTVKVKTLHYERDPYVVALALRLAKGKCQGCKKAAPFKRANGIPYLEVHHKKTLADGGSDRIDNAIALCPNCHRERHFGIMDKAK